MPGQSVETRQALMRQSPGQSDLAFGEAVFEELLDCNGIFRSQIFLDRGLKGMLTQGRVQSSPEVSSEGKQPVQGGSQLN